MIEIGKEPADEDRNREDDSLLSRHRFLKLGLLGGLSAATVLFNDQDN